MDVYFYEAFEEEAQQLKRLLGSGITAGFTDKTIQESKHARPPARLISIRTQSEIPLQWASQIDGILARSTGYDHLVRYKEKCQKDIKFGYLPLYCNRAVAEQAMLLWMGLLRKLPSQQQNFQRFHRDGLTGFECQGKMLLVVGVGNIGSEVVKIGNGLGMNVLGVDIAKKYDFVNYVSINEGLTKADVIACAMNLTKETTGYFGYETLKKAKKGSIFVNVARGEMSPSADLLRLLQDGHLGGVGLDVYNMENELAVSLRSGRASYEPEVAAVLELAKRKDAILTPHNSFNTAESVQRKAEHSIRQVEYFLKNGQFLWSVPE